MNPCFPESAAPASSSPAYGATAASYSQFFESDSEETEAERGRQYDLVFRVLRPGGHFAATDWCLTGRFDPADPSQKRALTDLLRGNGLQGLASTGECVAALSGAGFEVLVTRDLAQDCHPDTPWYFPLDGTGGGWRSLVRRPAGRRIVKNALSVLEKLRIVPRGSAFVQDFLSWGADALIALGRTGAFTPMYYIHGRKPETAI